jgi:hypothetical protein
MTGEVNRQQQDNDVDDIEDELDERWRPDLRELAQLLDAGVALATQTGRKKWETLRQQVLDKAPTDKFVLFAQPIETVTTLASYLETVYGTRPSLIIGGQPESVREAEIKRFREDPSVRFLVSSRAGGEGLNLQVARRLVHIDVPWNPMELEQRVGRVHRFGSRRTIVVDTLVVAGSRETDAYRIAHDKLREIAAALVPEDRFEELFARVMSLVPPEELQGVLAQGPLAPLSSDNKASVTTLVIQGFERWQNFDERYKEQRRRIGTLDPGAATWDDLAEFLRRTADAEEVVGFETLRFRVDGSDVVEDNAQARVLSLGPDLIALGETDGMPVKGPGERSATPVGLNSDPVVRALRKAGLPAEPTGAAVLGLSPASRDALGEMQLPERFGVLAFGKQLFSSTRGYGELGSASLEFFIIMPDKEPVPVPADRKRGLVRALAAAMLRRELKREDQPVMDALVKWESPLWQQLRRPPLSSESGRILHGITPLFAAVVTT